MNTENEVKIPQKNIMIKTLNDLQKLADYVFEVSEAPDKYALIVLGSPSGSNQASFEIYEPESDAQRESEHGLSNTFTVEMTDGWETELYNIVEEYLVEFYHYEPEQCSLELPKNCRVLSLEEAREILVNGRVCYVCDEGQAAHEYDVTARPAPMLGADYYVIARRSIYSEPTRLLVVSSADYVALSQWYRGA